MGENETLIYRGKVYKRYLKFILPKHAKEGVARLRKGGIPAQIGNDGLTIYTLREKPKSSLKKASVVTVTMEPPKERKQKGTRSVTPIIKMPRDKATKAKKPKPVRMVSPHKTRRGLGYTRRSDR